MFTSQGSGSRRAAAGASTTPPPPPPPTPPLPNDEMPESCYRAPNLKLMLDCFVVAPLRPQVYYEESHICGDVVSGSRKSSVRMASHRATQPEAGWQ